MNNDTSSDQKKNQAPYIYIIIFYTFLFIHFSTLTFFFI